MQHYISVDVYSEIPLDSLQTCYIFKKIFAVATNQGTTEPAAKQSLVLVGEFINNYNRGRSVPLHLHPHLTVTVQYMSGIVPYLKTSLTHIL